MVLRPRAEAARRSARDERTLLHDRLQRACSIVTAAYRTIMRQANAQGARQIGSMRIDTALVPLRTARVLRGSTAAQASAARSPSHAVRDFDDDQAHTDEALDVLAPCDRLPHTRSPTRGWHCRHRRTSDDPSFSPDERLAPGDRKAHEPFFFRFRQRRRVTPRRSLQSVRAIEGGGMKLSSPVFQFRLWDGHSIGPAALKRMWSAACDDEKVSVSRTWVGTSHSGVPKYLYCLHPPSLVFNRTLAESRMILYLRARYPSMPVVLQRL
ncbi:hypothetical protein ACFO6Q_13565 [Dokdonella ginsengisoli]|uniref:Uncharacterized protein n=2 Tax=Dokdonella ginsengisoli TaxID=363846 RepID=A0ABV9QWA7_9GAMM